MGNYVIGYFDWSFARGCFEIYYFRVDLLVEENTNGNLYHILHRVTGFVCDADVCL